MKKDKRDAYMRLATKKAALPLYEIAKHGATKERSDRALGVYEEAGTSTPEDTGRLDEATLAFYDEMKTRVCDGFMPHPKKEGWVRPVLARGLPQIRRVVLA